MSNAALFFHSNAFDTGTGRLLGRHSAGESFLRGFLRYAEADQLFMWNAAGADLKQLNALLQSIEPTSRPITWIPAVRRDLLGQAGVLNTPGPSLSEEAWLRRTVGARTYAICGITHTTATPRVMSAIGDMLIGPSEAYDALICTSSAVRASVERQLDGVRAYLEAEFGERKRAEPIRATIPLGVNSGDFHTTDADRRAWRERLQIPDDAVVALYVGRFNIREKMNPALMALALERAAQLTSKPIWWIAAGWAESEAEGEIYHSQTRALCPSVQYRVVDGRGPDVRFSIWSVADFFISFSDNIQESYGLTPVEAMAAGLPCVVTDWDGYKDTVRHGEDGFRIPTVAPAPGDGGDLAYHLGSQWMDFTNYAGAAAQFTAIDYRAAAEAIVSLVEDPQLRRRLGRQAQVRAREVFDWRAVIPQYQALWAEQNARRLAAPAAPPHREGNPFRPDPFELFASYPTRDVTSVRTVALAPDITVEKAIERLQAPIANYSRFNRPGQTETVEILENLSRRGVLTVEEAIAPIAPARRPFARRGLLWMARYGVLVLDPELSGQAD